MRPRTSNDEPLSVMRADTEMADAMSPLECKRHKLNAKGLYEDLVRYLSRHSATRSTAPDSAPARGFAG